MYAHRGMIEKAGSEAEIAGVLAHEISHVALRHGTAQATKAGKYQMGQIGSAILGAIIGGRTGEAVSTVGQFGFGAAFLKYSREYEKQADLLGAQIMARTGYDPRAMASMFQHDRAGGGCARPRVVEQPPESGQPLRVHHAEAQSLRVENAVNDTRQFQNVQARLRSMSPAPTSEEVAAQRRRQSISRRHHRRPLGRADEWRPLRPASRPTTKGTCSAFRCRPTGARCPSENAGDVCARRRLRRDQSAERVHARRAGRPGAQRDPRPQAGDRRAPRSPWRSRTAA